ncbi:MAG: hypothetical protein ABEH47_02210 [Haloferacaceae archaeon]
MPEIEITEDQRERLRAVQESLEADVVGKYGHVRVSDALEYLLDRYEADVTDAGGAGGTGTAPASDAGAGDGPPAVVEEDDDEGSTAADDEGSTAADDEGSTVTDDAGATATDDAGATAADDADGSADAATGDAAGGGSTADATSPGDAAALDAMMNLLDEHADKWREASSEEARYEVELPDGSTEGARTKDDVRGILFRHYR